MNKKPVLWRIIFVLVVLGCFAWSIFPLREGDFYDTFRRLAHGEKEKIETIIKLAKENRQNGKYNYDSEALLEAANEQGVDLTKFVTGRYISNNKDVINKVRESARASIRRGIDLAGGVEYLLELQENPDAETSEAKKSMNYQDQAIEILRNRLEKEKIFEAEISPVGKDLISLKAPITNKEERLRFKNIIERSAKLKFHLVADNNNELVQEYLQDKKAGKQFVPPVGYELKVATEVENNKTIKNYYFIKTIPEMGGKDIVSASPEIGQFGRRRISLGFNHKGAQDFSKVTHANVGKKLAVVLDGKLYCAPVIQTGIDQGQAIITGQFSRDEALNISNALMSGNLPVKIKVAAEFLTSPTLGSEAVRNGITAGLIGLGLVILFMVLYYLGAGLVANIALLANIVLVLGALAAFEATLTLPGIAGIILTIGMAVDANVLIFERIREELQNNKTIFNAVETGYSRAFTTILDSNLTTLFTALILMYVGSGPVKGFGVTLSIGIATSMFTALFLTRLVFDILLRFTKIQRLPMNSFFKRPNIDFLNLRFLAGGLSCFLIAGAIVIACLRGGDIFGVDFSGGKRITMSYQKDVPVAQVVQAVEEKGYKDVKAVYKTSLASVADNEKIEILVPDNSVNSNIKSSSSLADILNAKFPDAKFSGAQETVVGGLIGAEFTKAAIWALILALIGIIIYITIRFEFAYAMAAIVALVHDVVIATGIFLLVGELSLPVVAALLTILGYSLNDTIVVFDRIREDLGLIKDRPYKQIINLSINQTLSRTILTSLTTMLVLLVLFFMGGIAINDFVFVMLIGVVVGTYSSVFIASPIVAVWHRRIGKNVK